MKTALIALVGLLYPVLCFAQVHAAVKPITWETLPQGSVSAEDSFVLAHNGESYLYNPATGAERIPFLRNVFKPFGFSRDSRYFLYLRSNGILPGFALHRYDLAAGADQLISSRVVHHAAWGSGGRIAYIWLSGGSAATISVYDPETEKTSDIATGILDLDHLSWNPDGSELYYVELEPANADYFHDHRFTRKLWSYSMASKRATGIETAHAAASDGDRVITAGRQVPVPATAAVEGMAVAGETVYASFHEDSRPWVRRFDPQTGEWTAVAAGTLYAATRHGVVVRNQTASEVTFDYVHAGAVTRLQTSAAVSSPFKLPFEGATDMIQGGSLFSSGACDGSACQVSAHKQTLGYALDWLQKPEQGSARVLAIADGTVAAVVNNVQCNSILQWCRVGWDDYANPCNDNGGAGNYVAIAHADGNYSFYAHLKSGSVQVTPGQVVTQGTYIADQGHSGSAGNSGLFGICGDHLHLQRQVSPAVWAQSVPTDFTETPCALSCRATYISENLDNSASASASLAVILSPSAIDGAVRTISNRVVLGAPAPAGGAAVALSSSDGAVSVPASVTVPQGSTSATFALQTAAVSAPATATITATWSGETATATMTVRPLVLKTLVLSLNSVIAGNPLGGNEVGLSTIAAADTQIALSSSDPAVAAVPATVTIRAGSSVAPFSISLPRLDANKTVTLTATYAGASVSANLTIHPLVVNGFRLATSNVVGGGTVGPNNLAINTVAPAGGAVIALSSSNPALAPVPPSITVPEGTTTASFYITTSPTAGSTPVTISAALGGATSSQTLNVHPLTLSSFTVSKSTAAGGSSFSASVTLNAVAPASGASVSLTSSDPAVTVPSSVFIAPGRTNTGFTVQTSIVPAPVPVTLTASYGGVSKTVTVTVTAMGVQSLALSPAGTTLIAGKAATGVVTLDVAAPAGGAAVAITSSNPGAVTAPASVTVPAGSVSANFPVTPAAVATQTPVTLTATYNGSSRTLDLTVQPASLTALSMSPASIGPGGQSTGTVTLNGPAPSGGAVVTLTNSNPAAAVVPGSVTIAAGAASATFTATGNSMPAAATATITAGYNGVTQTATLDVTPTALASVSVNPAAVLGGNPSTGTVTLNGPAPAGGIPVALSSSDSSVTVPASVLVPAGAQSTTFTASTSTVQAAVAATISAAYNGVSRTATLTVNPIAMAGLRLSPTYLVGGTTSTATITITAPAPPGGAVVQLTSTDPALALVVPSVTVPAGATSAKAWIPVQWPTVQTVVTIAASIGGTTRTERLTIAPTVASAVSVSPSTLGGGASATGTVTLNGAAPSGGAPVTLSSSHPAAAVPASVTVPAGAKTATFPISSTAVAAATPVTLSAAYGGATATATITVAPVALASLTLSPASVGSGGLSSGTVTLNGPAPAGGAAVALASQNATATVPPSVTVPAGGVSAAFAITTGSVSTSTPVVISATYGTTQSATLTVTPTVLSSLSLSRTSTTSGQTVTATINLNGPAPQNGAAVQLTSSNPAFLAVPAQFPIAAGATGGSFDITAPVVASSTSVTITAFFGGVARSVTLTVNPVTVSILSFAPNTLPGGARTTATMFLNAPAPPGGATITLTSSDPAVFPVPATFTIWSGSRGNFYVTTAPVTASTQVTITATYNGSSRSTVVTVTP